MAIFLPELVDIGFEAENKEQCLKKIIDIFSEQGIITDKKKFFEKMKLREEQMSTGIGYNIAIPHIRDDSAALLKGGVFLLKEELDFDSVDEQPVRLIVFLTVPENLDKQITVKDDVKIYMKLLAKVTGFLRNEKHRMSVFQCGDREKLYSIFRRLEDEIYY